jgi:hypothetical protein
MTIKEVFKECAFCRHVYFNIWCDGHHMDTWKIHNHKEFDDFINAYGNEEIRGWSAENKIGDTHFVFCLKSE